MVGLYNIFNKIAFCSKLLLDMVKIVFFTVKITKITDFRDVTILQFSSVKFPPKLLKLVDFFTKLFTKQAV